METATEASYDESGEVEDPREQHPDAPGEPVDELPDTTGEPVDEPADPLPEVLV
jgi:hypothetical protein